MGKIKKPNPCPSPPPALTIPFEVSQSNRLESRMLQEIARVFSSNGVLVQGSQSVPAPNRKGAVAPGGPGPADGVRGGDNSGSVPKFDQASSKLELSRRGRELQSTTADSPRQSTLPSGGTSLAQGPAAASAQSDGSAPADAKATPAKSAANGQPLSPEQEKQVRDPEKHDRQVKAQTEQRAALAPSDPSGQDRAVAAAAAQMAAQAQAEMAKGEGSEGGSGADTEKGPGADAPNGPGTAAAARMRAYGRPSAARASLSVYA